MLAARTFPLDDCLRDSIASPHGDASNLSPLIKAGLIHVQFESIHPILDRCGRIGRFLATLYLCILDRMEHPPIYLNLHVGVQVDPLSWSF